MRLVNKGSPPLEEWERTRSRNTRRAFFVCPTKHCETKLETQIDVESLIAKGEAAFQCPRCFGAMREDVPRPFKSRVG